MVVKQEASVRLELEEGAEVQWTMLEELSGELVEERAVVQDPASVSLLGKLVWAEMLVGMVVVSLVCRVNRVEFCLQEQIPEKYPALREEVVMEALRYVLIRQRACNEPTFSPIMSRW